MSNLPKNLRVNHFCHVQDLNRQMTLGTQGIDVPGILCLLIHAIQRWTPDFTNTVILGCCFCISILLFFLSFYHFFCVSIASTLYISPN